jgi:hypothetical protein
MCLTAAQLATPYGYNMYDVAEVLEAIIPTQCLEGMFDVVGVGDRHMFVSTLFLHQQYNTVRTGTITFTSRVRVRGISLDTKALSSTGGRHIPYESAQS